jgi:hypothetical protein
VNAPGVTSGGYEDTGKLTTGGHLSGAGGAGGLNIPGVATGGYVDTGGLTTGGQVSGAGGFMNVSGVANDGYVDTSGHARTGTGMLNAYGVTTGGYVESGIGRPPNNPHRSDTMHNHSIDSWIDELDLLYMPIIQENFPPSDNLAMHILTNQQLPRLDVPHFTGNAEHWVYSVISFKEIMHQQAHLTGAQRMSLLVQYLEGEAKRCIHAYSKDWYGYVLALKRLKAMWSQSKRSKSGHSQSHQR